MGGSQGGQEFRKRMERIEALLHEVERYADPAAREHTRELVQAVLGLHGAGLERILETVAAAGESGLATIDALGRDDLAGSLLLLHGLHPVDVETRVRQALDRVGQYVRSQGGHVELVGTVGGVVRLRLHARSSSAAALRSAVEEAIYAKAPDVAGVEIEAVTNGPPTEDGRARIALPLLRG
jgi:hypothetical protein